MAVRVIGAQEVESVVEGLSAAGVGVVHVYEDGTPVAATLVPAFRALALEGKAKPAVSFYELDPDETTAAELDALGVDSFPTFLVVGKADYPHGVDPPAVVASMPAVQIIAAIQVTAIARLEAALARLGLLHPTA